MIHAYRGVLIGTTIAIALCGVAGSQTQRAEAKAPSPNRTDAARSPVTAADAIYAIGSMDVLKIDVWQEKELSGEVPVRPDGKISLPLLGDVQAAGLTATQLSSQITEGLKKYVNEPRVTVMVAQVNSRRIYVLGEVQRQGALTLLPNMTVLQALSDVGGLSPFAHQTKIYLMRQGESKRLPFNYKDVMKGKNLEQNIELRPGDTIFVP